MLKYFILTIIPFFIMYYLGEETINSHNIQNIIKDNNYSYNLGLLPYYSEDRFIQYYELIDYINENHKNLSIYEKPKIYIDIETLSENEKPKWEIFKSIIDYAYHKDILVWLLTTIPLTIKKEYRYYEKCKKLNYTNLGISLATYNKNIHKKVDEILKNNGTIRLEYGNYYGDITDKDIIKQNLIINAEKLIETGKYHMLSIDNLGYLHKIERNNLEIELKKYKKTNFTKSIFIGLGNYKSYLYYTMDKIRIFL